MLACTKMYCKVLEEPFCNEFKDEEQVLDAIKDHADVEDYYEPVIKEANSSIWNINGYMSDSSNSFLSAFSAMTTMLITF